MQSNIELPAFRIERSRSKSGKHQYSSMLYVYRKTQGLIQYSKLKFTEEQVKGIYAIGEAKLVKIKADHGDYIIYLAFVKNYKNRVKGFISIYTHNGELAYRAKYINGYLVKSKGNPLYAWLVRLVVDTLKIPVAKTKLGDEK